MPHPGLQLCQSALPCAPVPHSYPGLLVPANKVSCSFIRSEVLSRPMATGCDWQGDNYRLGTWPVYCSLDAVTSVLSQLQDFAHTVPSSQSTHPTPSPALTPTSFTDASSFI